MPACCIFIFLLSNYDVSREQTGELSVHIVPFGPSQDVIDTISADLMRNSSVQNYLKQDKYRFLYLELVDSDAENISKGKDNPHPPDRFRATLFNYTKNRTIFVDGPLNEPNSVEITESETQPLPSKEEFDEALKVLMEDEQIASAIREKQIQPYRPMPPLIETKRRDGTIERTIAVGLLPTALSTKMPSKAKEEEEVEDKHRHEIVGVNMIRREVIRFKNNAPSNSAASNAICGAENANQAAAKRGMAGQYWVEIKIGPTLVWKFLAVRPAASSGTNGSGIELRYVDYHGKRVLYQAHVPILNVQYRRGPCGPYRDWQWEEGMIEANGTDVAPGFRQCPTPARTILDTGSDTGNFLGVAIYRQGSEVVLVSEMQAGWYRYISEWRLDIDGTIRPRFGFSAVRDSCVCDRHHHHAYWRFDLDIGTPGNNRVLEFFKRRRRSKWNKIKRESKRFRDPRTQRKWRVENISTGQAYEIIPGPNDGIAKKSPFWRFARGDLWILRYHGASEIDDGSVATGPPHAAQLSKFLNRESVEATDVVIWYGAHFNHGPGTHSHKLGPNLKPINW
jgi:hypothetical protein